MKRPRFQILALLTIFLLLAGSLLIASHFKPVREDRKRNEPNEQELQSEKSPPEDWFISQRVAHGGIPVGALRKAGEQAAALARSGGPLDSLAAARWKFVGPTNIGGRVVDIAVDPVAADTIYVASATGGVWKSTDKGARFTSIWPATNTQAMGALVITSTGTLFAGTGEANPGGGSITYGGSGIYRSVDGGATWQVVGLTDSGAIGRLAVDPTNSQHIFAAVAGDLYNPGGERGVYESTDGGTTWNQVLAGDNDTTGAIDLAIDPTNPNRVFAAMWDHLREPDLRTYGGVGSGVYRSTDGGTTWQRLAGGLPAASATIGRIGVALGRVEPATPLRHHHSNEWTVPRSLPFRQRRGHMDQAPYRRGAVECAVDLWMVVRPVVGGSSRPGPCVRGRSLPV